MKLFEFDINNYVYVQLTERGISELKRQHDEFNGFCNLGEFEPPATDEGGWSKHQMWELMQSLGSRCGNGFNNPFMTGFRFNEDDLTKVDG